MDITKNLTNKTSEKVTMQLDLKASTSEEETLSDHYVILRTLGKGNFAEVKLSCHLQTEEQVAIKVLQNGRRNDFGIQTELDILKTLDHPYIIKLFHVINTEDYTYMVLEHAAGGDLVSHIERVGSLQEEEAQHIFTQLVCAVHYCHKNNIAHRDIKLDNMLLDDKGNIKLCDFGLATRVTPGQSTKGFCGTIGYCAPELFSDKEYDAKAVDIWSMGVVLYAMVTADFPFKGSTYSDMEEEMQDPKYHLPYRLSENIADIIEQLFTVKPEQRPKIYDIRQHQWVKAKEEICKTTPYLEALCNNPNPSILVAMWRMGYDPKATTACLREKKFNSIMATYLILNHKSPRDHSKYAEKFLQACVAMSPADALTGVTSQRGLSELALSALLEEHRVDDEKGSRKKTMRSLSMPATLCCQQKGNKCPHAASKLARRKITYVKSRCLAVDSMICYSSSSGSLSSESISFSKYLSFKTSQELNTPNNSSCTQSSGSYREVPHIVNTTGTYDITKDSLREISENTFDDVTPEGIPEIQISSLQETSKNSFDDVIPADIPEIQISSLQASSDNTFDDGLPEGIPEIQRSSLQTSSKNTFDDVPTEGRPEILRSSLQTSSKNTFDDVPTEGRPEIQISSLQTSSKNTFDDVPTEGRPEIQRSSLQPSSKNTFDDVPNEGRPEIQRSSLKETSTNRIFDAVTPEDIIEVQRSSLHETYDNVSHEDIIEAQRSSLHETYDNVSPEDIIEVQRSSLHETYDNVSPEDISYEDITEIQKSSPQSTSNNISDDVPPEDVTTASASCLSRGWKRVKKRIGNCLRRLCCCMPACKRSHVSQEEVVPVEVESGAVAHTQLHGVPKTHSCVSQSVCFLMSAANNT